MYLILSDLLVFLSNMKIHAAPALSQKVMSAHPLTLCKTSQNNLLTERVTNLKKLFHVSVDILSKTKVFVICCWSSFRKQSIQQMALQQKLVNLKVLCRSNKWGTSQDSFYVVRSFLSTHVQNIFYAFIDSTNLSEICKRCCERTGGWYRA